MHTRKHLHVLFTLPSLVIYAVFFVFPLFLGIYYSFTDWNGMTASYHLIGLKNYFTVFSTGRAMSALGFTMRYAFMLSITVTLLSLFLAMLLNQEFRGRSLVRAIYFFPAVLSALVVGLIFNEIYYRIVPLFGKMLGIQALSKSPASSPDTAPYAILFANVWQAAAIPTTIVLAGLQSVPRDLYEAASIDGAGAACRFRYITLPYIAPTLSVVLVLSVKDGLLLFDYVQAITGGGPAGSTHSIGTFLYQQAFEYMRYSLSVASSVVLFLLVACFGAFYIFLMNRLEAKES